MERSTHQQAPVLGTADNLVGPLLTDLYQITMAYAYWKLGKCDEAAVFDLYFRKNPFGGEYTVFAGLSAALEFISAYRFQQEDIDYLRTVLPHAEEAFFSWLLSIDCSSVKVWALKEGRVCFPQVPLLRVEGPLGICQLLETTLLNLTNFASLVTTNAARYKCAAGPSKRLLEFGLRRAQGPNGAMSASRYCYLGGFDATSNVKAGQLFDISVAVRACPWSCPSPSLADSQSFLIAYLQGTHAHAFVCSFTSLSEIKDRKLKHKVTGEEVDFVDLVLAYKQKLGRQTPNEGELTAFVGYALCFPDSFLALVDTYNTLKSGVPNFITVALALHELGYSPKGVRLDSGDIAYLSKETRKMFIETANRFNIPDFARLNIAASNEISESTLLSLRQQGHEVDTFGIGTNLVTCTGQTALGCVYKLVELNGKPRLKISQDINKITIPGRKEAFRLMDAQGRPIVDLLVSVGEKPPVANQRIMCRHPFLETKRAIVVPTACVPLHELVFDGKVVVDIPSLNASRAFVMEEIGRLREDHVRALNPTPYKVSVTQSLYESLHQLWFDEAPLEEIS